VSAPCGLILENWNLEKMQHVMLKKNGSKKCKQKATAERTINKKEITNAQKMQI
jgi:hypothetical protein